MQIICLSGTKLPGHGVAALLICKVLMHKAATAGSLSLYVDFCYFNTPVLDISNIDSNLYKTIRLWLCYCVPVVKPERLMAVNSPHRN